MGLVSKRKRTKTASEFVDDALAGDISIQKEEIDVIGTAAKLLTAALALLTGSEVLEKVSRGGVEKQRDKARRKLRK